MNVGMKKVLARGLIGCVAVTALVGVLHAPFGRGLLKKVGGCPVGHASAADVENVRRTALIALRGNTDAAAPSRVAFGFAIGKASRDDVLTWATEHGLRCETKREGTLVACTDVPANFLPDPREEGDGPITNLNFGFRLADGRLVNVSALTTKLPPRDAAQRSGRIIDRMRRDLGDPSSADGEFTTDRFAKGEYATSAIAYRFNDYIAEFSATSIPASGVTLREHYVAVDD
jgi:hypothetical protein